MMGATFSGKSLVRSFITLSFGNVLAQFILLIAFAALGRALGPDEFGWWSFSYAYMLYLFRLGEFGLEVMGVRAIAGGSSSSVSRISSVLTTRFLLAVLLFFCALLANALGIIPAQARTLFLLLSLAVFPVGLSLEWAYEAIQRFEFVSAARVMKAVLFTALVLTTVRGSESSVSSAMFYVLSLVFPAVFLLIDSGRRFGKLPLGFNWGESKALLKEAFPVGVATFLSQYSLFFATTFLGYVASAADVGFFSAAHRLIVFVWAYGIVASNRVLLPTLSRLHRESHEAFDLFVIRATRLFLIMAFPIGVLGTLTSRDIVELVFGQSFSPASPVFEVLVWVLVIAISRSAAEISYWASDRQRLYVSRILLLGVLHTVGVPVGYYLDGLRGVAIGMLCAESLYSVWLVWGARIAWNRSISVTLARVAVASSITLVGLLVVSMSALPSILVGIVVYVGLLVAAREFTSADCEMVRALFTTKAR